MLIAYVTTGQDIETLREMFANGAILNEDGSITLPTPTPEPEETIYSADEGSQTEIASDTQDDASISETIPIEDNQVNSLVLRVQNFFATPMRIIVVLSASLVLFVVMLVTIKVRRKKTAK